MEKDQPALVTGVVKTPRSITGAMHRCEADVEMQDGPARRIVWDVKTRLASVFDEKGELLGSTERQNDGRRQVILASGGQPPVSFEDRWFARLVWIDGTRHKSVMSLEGSKRVFGEDRLKLEHRDFKSEVRFRCLPEWETAAIIVAFEVYWSRLVTSDTLMDAAAKHPLTSLVAGVVIGSTLTGAD